MMEILFLSAFIAVSVSLIIGKGFNNKISIEFNAFKQEINKLSLERYEELMQLMIEQNAENKEMLKDINEKINQLRGGNNG